jgi:hypothetical protein
VNNNNNNNETTWLPWLPCNINNPNPQISKACLTTLNLNNFEIIKDMVLKITASRSPSMALPPLQHS